MIWYLWLDVVRMVRVWFQFCREVAIEMLGTDFQHQRQSRHQIQDPAHVHAVSAAATDWLHRQYAIFSC